MNDDLEFAFPCTFQQVFTAKQAVLTLAKCVEIFLKLKCAKMRLAAGLRADPLGEA